MQYFSSFGGSNQFSAPEKGKPSQWAGFKSGLSFQELDFEWGMDAPLGTGKSGPLLFQTKAQVVSWNGGKAALGIAGVPLSDQRRSADPFGYAMVRHDLQFLSLHTGYGYQTAGNGVLLGMDKTCVAYARNLNFNIDLIQTRRQRGFTTAVGAKYELNDHFVLESWCNFPDQGMVSVVAKLNFVFKF